MLVGFCLSIEVLKKKKKEKEIKVFHFDCIQRIAENLSTFQRPYKGTLRTCRKESHFSCFFLYLCGNNHNVWLKNLKESGPGHAAKSCLFWKINILVFLKHLLHDWPLRLCHWLKLCNVPVRKQKVTAIKQFLFFFLNIHIYF